MLVSGFTFIHNCLAGGYPLKQAIKTVLPYVDEIVIADLESDDGTRNLLINEFGNDIRIIDGVWDYKAGETLANAHALNSKCDGDVIIHFEADEVFDEFLVREIRQAIDNDFTNISVERIQIEQNFSKIRWSPHWVHRVFPKGSVIKDGETTNKKHSPDMLYLSGEYGYLWDCTNCFRDSWFNRIKQQSELRSEEFNMLFVPDHINLPHILENVDEFLKDKIWTNTFTPLDIPEILKPLLGKTKYE